MVYSCLRFIAVAMGFHPVRDNWIWQAAQDLGRKISKSFTNNRYSKTLMNFSLKITYTLSIA